jgi:hypothetical protein
MILLLQLDLADKSREEGKITTLICPKLCV